MTYRRQIPVEFNHCDPHGIVFYPRYFEMLNSVVENFFREAMDYSFARMTSDGFGVPTIRIGIEFRAPSRLGEVLDWTLSVRRFGRSSVLLRISAHGGGQLRLSSDVTLVFAAREGGARSWPEPVRSRLESMHPGDADEPA